jgi:type I restriction enzyme R subunit
MSDASRPFRYEPVALSNESTVVAEFVPANELRDERYQSEAELERDLVRRLQAQAYEYLPLTSEADLIANLRHQLEALNKMTFSDSEWQRFFSEK